LEVAPDVPLIGFAGPFVDQKGWNLLAEVILRWVEYENAQWVVLGEGEGESKYEALLRRLANASPNRLSAKFEFSERLSHQIKGGADIILLPSHDEPCGANLLSSLKYGAVPVVRATGGLADTICDATAENLASKAANGFSFEAYDSTAMEETLRRAAALFTQQRPVWERLVDTGMRLDGSWRRSAEQYSDLYERLQIERKLRRGNLSTSG
jgi:starch synthase